MGLQATNASGPCPHPVQDATLEDVYGRLAFELRSLKALAVRLLEDQRSGGSGLQGAQDLAALQDQMRDWGAEPALPGASTGEPAER